MMDPDELHMLKLDDEDGLPGMHLAENVLGNEDGHLSVEDATAQSLTHIANALPFPNGTDALVRRGQTRRRITTIPEARVGEMPEAPVYPRHPVCGHVMDDTIKYTRRSTHAIFDETTGYARYNELIPCPHCTEDIRRSVTAKRAVRNIHHLFGGANIPRYAEHWDFRNVPASVDAHAVQTIAFYTNANIEKMAKGKIGVNLFLCGEPGSGKTSLAISALRRYMEAGIACFLICMPDYFNLVYRGMNKFAPPELARLEESAMDVPVLVMDDFSSENPTLDTLKRVFLMIERRTAKGLTTIITSNNTLEVLEHYWYMPTLGEETQQQSGRILRRLRERFKVVPVAPWRENG